jgi:hypothetical protein
MRYFKLWDTLHRWHVQDFSLLITLSHTFVTGLGQSALRESR